MAVRSCQIWIRKEENIRLVLYSPAAHEIKRGDMNLLDEWQNRRDTFVWIDFGGDDPELEKELLMSRFGLHPMAILDAQRVRHPPKIESFDDHVLYY